MALGCCGGSRQGIARGPQHRGKVLVGWRLQLCLTPGLAFALLSLALICGREQGANAIPLIQEVAFLVQRDEPCGSRLFCGSPRKGLSSVHGLDGCISLLQAWDLRLRKSALYDKRSVGLDETWGVSLLWRGWPRTSLSELEQGMAVILARISIVGGRESWSLRWTF